MKIINKNITFSVNFICKCGCPRFIRKEIYPTYAKILCVECEKQYAMKIFTEEIE